MSTTIKSSPFATMRGDFPALETLPSLIPSSAETLYAFDCWLESITLSNISAAAVTILIADKQASPLAVLPTISLDANGTVIFGFDGRYCPGGITWVASDGAAIVGYARWRYRP